ncbi:hypothetical protein BO226_22725 [Rhodococcus sp. 2G]|nr:hypothetical protein BO226_22725 [Rhodococcus sp. 2G]
MRNGHRRHGADEIGTMRREHPRDGSSPVVADNVRATTGYRLDERRDVADEQVEAVVTAAGWWGAGRVAALIRGEGANPRRASGARPPPRRPVQPLLQSRRSAAKPPLNRGSAR